MARKISITKEMIKKAAFEIAESEGIDSVTARKLADKAGCSTQPIFRIYENMEQLHKDVFEMAIQEFSDFYGNYCSQHSEEDKPFVRFGMAYIDFAVKQSQLFCLLFLSKERYGKSLYELLNGSTGAFMKEIARAKSLGVKDPGELFMKMWIFIHGAASMAITGDYDLPEDETIRLLRETYVSSAS
ncbi:MAG: TetR/AcrR family transcriptional regulator [Lachnospiraceae bacterium]|nr:TetR/AcrR family transcriptional regulator [Lachnospiraceae bacterium]